jgi:hypothetical protein
MIEKYQQIVKMLLSLTSEDKLEWEKTSGNEYKVSIGKNDISILYHEASPYSFVANAAPDVSFLKLLLWDQNGELLDEEKVEKRDYGSIDYDNLMNLYVAARRSYGKVYETLDDILLDLEKAGKEDK